MAQDFVGLSLIGC